MCGWCYCCCSVILKKQKTQKKRGTDGKSPSITPKPGDLSPVPLPKDSILIGNRYIALKDFYTYNFKSIGMSWLTNILRSNYNLISVLDLSGCGLSDDNIAEFCYAWRKLKHTSYLQILSLGSNLQVTDASMKELFDCIKKYHSQLYYIMLYDTGITDKTCTYIYDFYKFHFGEPSTDYQIECDQRWQSVLDHDFNEQKIDEYFDKLLKYGIIEEFDFLEAKRDYYSMKIGNLRRKKVEMIGLRGNTQLQQIRLNWCKCITSKGISKLDKIFKEGLLPGVLPDTGAKHSKIQRRSSLSKNAKLTNVVSAASTASRASFIRPGTGQIVRTIDFDPTNLQYFDEKEKEEVKYHRQHMAILVDALDLFDKRGDKHQQNLEFEISKKRRSQADIRRKIKKLKKKLSKQKEQKKVCNPFIFLLFFVFFFRIDTIYML